MQEISGRIVLFLESVAARRGLTLDVLCEGLPVSAPQIKSAIDVDWEIFAGLCERFEQLTSPEETIQAGREAFQTAAALPFVKVAGLLFALDRLYQAALLWIAPMLYRHAQFQVTRTSPTIEVQIEISPALRGSLAWLRIMGGGLISLPTVIGLSEAEVQMELSAHRGRYQVTVPRTSLREKLSVFRHAARSTGAVYEFFSQNERLRKIQQAEALAARAAKDSEHLFQTVVESISELIILAEPDGEVRFVNATLEKLTGYQRHEIVGKTGFSLVHPEDLPLAASSLQRLLDSPREEITAVLRSRIKNGDYRTFEISGRNLLQDPAIHGILLVARDITERQRAEAALHEKERAYSSLLSNLFGMAYRCRNDPQWTMELVTAGCLALTGYTQEELRLNREVAFTDLILPEDAAPLWEKCQANLAARRVCQNEYRIRTKSGELRWVSDIAHGLYSEQGELLAVEGFITDITQRRRLEEQLAHSQRLESIGRLAGGIAHDFNNLLGALLGYTFMLKEDLPEGSPQHADVEEIETILHRASDLTKQLLTFAKRQRLQTSVVDLSGLVLQLGGLLRRVLGSNIELIVLADPELWLVEADPSQLEQVIMNLAVNARDAMPSGGKLTIQLKNVPADPVDGLGERVQLSISDTGLGISEELLDHIFEPFFTTKGASHGTGLGLATVYGIVEQNKGTISVQSRPNHGTTFVIHLPKTNQPPKAAPQKAQKFLEVGRGTLLLVEDHPGLRSVMSRALEAAGYRVISYHNAVEALTISEERLREVRLMVTDIIMPEISGITLAERLRARRSELPILFVSGYSQEPIDLPNAHFLAKPFSPERLSREVFSILEPGKD